MRMFESYNAENDQRLATIERRKPDVLNEEKLVRLDSALGGARAGPDEAREHRVAFETSPDFLPFGL